MTLNSRLSRIFDINLIRSRRDKYAYTDKNYHFLLREIYSILLENLKGRFDLCLNIGAYNGELNPFLNLYDFYVEKIVHCDCSYNMVNKIPGLKVVVNEENLPFRHNTFDLIISAMYLHHVNDLPRVLLSIKNILKDKGVFLGSIFGPKTLHELRHSIAKVDKSMNSISPFIDIKDAGKLLEKSGFKFSVATSEIITINYSSVEKLFSDIKNTAQSNVLTNRNKGFFTKKTFEKIIREYNNFCCNKITSTFEVIILTGLK